jgi:ribonuclease J
MMQGAKVIYGKNEGIHVSGHACQEDQKLMLGLTRPKFFLPVHGEHRMLVKHSQTAQSMGIPAENMVVIQNGDIVELSPDSIKIAGQVPSGIELMDNSAGILRANVLAERQRLAEDGMVTIAAVISNQGKLVAAPQVHLRGVVTTVPMPKWESWVSGTLELALSNRWDQYAQSDRDDDIDWEGLKAYLERELNGLMRRELKSRASLLFLMQSTRAVEPAMNGSADIRQRRSRRSAVAVS